MKMSFRLEQITLPSTGLQLPVLRLAVFPRSLGSSLASARASGALWALPGPGLFLYSPPLLAVPKLLIRDYCGAAPHVYAGAFKSFYCRNGFSIFL